MAEISNLRNPAALFSFSLLLILLISSDLAEANGKLTLHYYSESCPRAEAIVKEQVLKLYHKHGNTAVSWVRSLFHDCMVESCDASLLLESTGETMSEQTARRNFGLRNFKYVATIKDLLEKECPNTVSCADIIALSARDGAALLGGPKFDIKTGRRDSRESFLKVLNDHIPDHNDSISIVLSRFKKIGLDAEKTVAILGAHSVGRVHCVNLVGRLYPTVDPTIDPEYGMYLKKRCPNDHPDPKAVLYSRNDRKTPMIIDNMYYKGLLHHKGLLGIDQGLIYDSRTLPYVKKMAMNNTYFHEQFALAMVLLSENNPLTGSLGEIRKDCRFANK